MVLLATVASVLSVELLSQSFSVSQASSSLGTGVSAAEECIFLRRFAAALGLSVGLFSLYVLCFSSLRASFELPWSCNSCFNVFYFF